MRIGALARQRAAEPSDVVRAECAAVRRGGRARRAPVRCARRGTVVGSIAFADPSAELPDRAARARRRGRRSAARRRADGRRRRLLHRRVRARASSPTSSSPRCASRAATRRARARRSSRSSRRHGDLPICGVARRRHARRRRRDRRRPASRSAASAPRPSAHRASRRRSPAHDADRGALQARAARCAARDHDPPSDRHGSADFRRHLAVVLTRRSAQRQAERARGRSHRMPEKVRIASPSTASAHDVLVEPRTLLLDFLRDELGLTGAHVGCEHGVCGACTVLVDGETVALVPHVRRPARRRRRSRRSSRSPTADGTLHPLQQAFTEEHGLQCGFCTPGMLMATVRAAASTRRTPSRTTSARPSSGNLCRCTGYQNIVDAVCCGRRSPRPGSRSGRGGRRMSSSSSRRADRASRTRWVGKTSRARKTRSSSPAARSYIGDVIVPGMLHARRAAQPARPRAHPLDRHRAARGAARRRRGHHRRRRGRADRADARVLRRARAAARDRRREGALPRRGGRRRRGHRAATSPRTPAR